MSNAPPTFSVLSVGRDATTLRQAGRPPLHCHARKRCRAALATAVQNKKKLKLTHNLSDDQQGLAGDEVLSRNNSIQPQMNADKRRWKGPKAKSGRCGLNHQTVG